ncbi:hypothetical protein XENTR_v10015362 [Xenopus tropicalis]|nr:uncharacterized protein xbg100494087 isoform X2 [Xenopus tropicalis]XP_031757828.1 uncharacterized protein xbg100494087 isoform X2 [Xenopus tropicalis]KAE8605876.1 hypothetical protein XENTR_v10015362 [Xenopus tropicalis]
MEENFLFLGTVGTYPSAPGNMMKREPREEMGGCSQGIKREVPDISPGLSDGTPNIIVKIEPDGESYGWSPKLNGVQETAAEPGIQQHYRANMATPMDESQQHHRANMAAPMDESQQQAERERQRKARFSEEENDVLINSVMPHYDKLFGKLATRTSTAVKNALWREIASAVNAISAYPRSLQNCKKRYADVKRKVKEKLCKVAKQRRATGGTVPLNISFWPYERIMEKIISADAIAAVPGATDSGRMADPTAAGPSDFDAECEYFPDIQDESGSARSEMEDSQMPLHHFPADKEDPRIVHMDGGIPDPQEETRIVQEEPSRERGQNPCRSLPNPKSREPWSPRYHSMRDHTTLIYAEQSHFRRTMAKKLDILNSNVKALNKNVKAFQHSFNQSIMALSQSVQQQNSIFEKLSSNLLLMAQQQQQHNQLCMSAIKQIFQIFPSSAESLSVPNAVPSDAPSEIQTLKVPQAPCAHRHEATEPRRPSSPSGEAAKRRRH